MTHPNHLRLVVSNEKPEDSVEHDWYRLEFHDRMAEHYRRKLGLIATERGLTEEERNV